MFKKINIFLNIRLKPSINKLQKRNNMKLYPPNWLHNVSHSTALNRIKQRKFLETPAGLLPKICEIEQVKEKVFAYVDSRIENGVT
jgi:hypothetical protein